MKRAQCILFFVLILGLQKSFSQDLGVQAGLDFMKPLKAKNDTANYGIRPGIHADVAYLLTDFGFPVSSVISLGAEYTFAAKDSAKIERQNLTTGSYTDTTVLAKTTSYAMMFGAGYELPQEADQFLFINLNWAMGYLNNRTVFQLQNLDVSSEQIFYKNTEIKDNVIKSGYFVFDAGASAYYEFKKFRLFIKAMYRFGIGRDTDYRTGDTKQSIHFTAGIFLPIVKF